MIYNVNTPSPFGYTPQQTRAGFNQAMSQAHADADMRYNMKPLDRAGMSRGAGQRHMASISSAQNLADGVAKAYGLRADDAVSNANVGLASQAAAEGLGLGVSAIAQQNQYANALDALQRQQAAYGFRQNILGGLLGGNSLNNFLGF